jgi:hypothetical protein
MENDGEINGEEVDVIGPTIESTQADALEGLEATPSKEDVLAIKEATV